MPLPSGCPRASSETCGTWRRNLPRPGPPTTAEDRPAARSPRRRSRRPGAERSPRTARLHALDLVRRAALALNDPQDEQPFALMDRIQPHTRRQGGGGRLDRAGVGLAVQQDVLGPAAMIPEQRILA